jgi:hypothetical protein
MIKFDGGEEGEATAEDSGGAGRGEMAGRYDRSGSGQRCIGDLLIRGPPTKRAQTC